MDTQLIQMCLPMQSLLIQLMETLALLRPDLYQLERRLSQVTRPLMDKLSLLEQVQLAQPKPVKYMRERLT